MTEMVGVALGKRHVVSASFKKGGSRAAIASSKELVFVVQTIRLQSESCSCSGQLEQW